MSYKEKHDLYDDDPFKYVLLNMTLLNMTLLNMSKRFLAPGGLSAECVQVSVM